jgi:hypothetical protein
MLSEQFSRRNRLAVKHRVNWLIRDAENVFLQGKLELPSIKEMPAIDAGRCG